VCLVSQQLRRQQKAAIKVPAVDREQVHFVFAASAADVPAWRASTRADPNDHDISCRAELAPFHLDPPEVAANLKREVGATVLGDRP
jgi:hypothetical protein